MICRILLAPSDSALRSRAMCPTSEIDFERVVILMMELVRGELIRIAMCSMHPELVVHDCLSPANRVPRIVVGKCMLF